MLRLRPTYEEMLREAKTRRLRILPERERRTQQGMLLDEVDFDDFDLNKYDKKTILMNENPQKGTQTDIFDKTFSIETSESMKSVDEKAMESQEEQETTQDKQQPEQEEPERERGKSMMRRIYDNLFGHDEFQEEREELLNRRTQREAEEEEQTVQTEQMEEEEGDDLPMNVKKSYEPSSSSSNSSSRSVLLPIEEGALSEHIQSSAPISVQSSVRSDRTIEYIEESPIVSVISSRRSQETIEYIRSRSSSNKSRTSSS